MSNQTAEEKLIRKIVNVLRADSVILNYTSGRIYSSHVSTIQSPEFPAISIFLLNSRALFSPPNAVDISVQIDSWLPGKNFDMTDVLNLHRRLRANLQRQNLTDSSLSLIVSQCIEQNAGPLMYEEDTNLYHYPVSYTVRAS